MGLIYLELGQDKQITGSENNNEERFQLYSFWTNLCFLKENQRILGYVLNSGVHNGLWSNIVVYLQLKAASLGLGLIMQ